MELVKLSISHNTKNNNDKLKIDPNKMKTIYVLCKTYVWLQDNIFLQGFLRKKDDLYLKTLLLLYSHFDIFCCQYSLPSQILDPQPLQNAFCWITGLINNPLKKTAGHHISMINSKNWFKVFIRTCLREKLQFYLP